MDIAHAAKLVINNQPVVNWRCVYERTFLPLQPPLLDELGAGDMVCNAVPPNFPHSNPHYSYTANGLLLSIERPASAPSGLAISEFAAAMTEAVVVPDSFVVVATFDQLRKVPLVPVAFPELHAGSSGTSGAFPPSGAYAPVVLIYPTDLLGKPMGVSCQFNPVTPMDVHLRVLGTGTGTAQGNPIAQNLVDKMRAGATFRLTLAVNRTATGGRGSVSLFIDDEEASSFPFEFLKFTTATAIYSLVAGIGTRDGSLYRASVNLRDFQIWTPLPPYNSPQ